MPNTIINFNNQLQELVQPHLKPNAGNIQFVTAFHAESQASKV